MRYFAVLLSLALGLALLAGASPVRQQAPPSVPLEDCPWTDSMTRAFSVNKVIAVAVATCAHIAAAPTQAEVEALLVKQFKAAAKGTFGCKKCTVDEVNYTCEARSTVTVANVAMTADPVLTSSGTQQCFSKLTAENYTTWLNNNGISGGGWALTDPGGDDLDPGTLYKLFRVEANGNATTVRECICPE
jgi:hypothetical protein